MTSRSTEGHKKVICKRCEVKKVKNKNGPMMSLALIVTKAEAFVHIPSQFSEIGNTRFSPFSLHIAYK